MIKKRFATKRGDPTDIAVFGVFLFALAVGFIFVIIVSTEIKSGLDDSIISENQYYNQTTQTITNITEGGLNKAYIFLFVGLILSIMLSSFLVRVHPAFFVIYLILFIFVALVGIALSNAYDTFKDNQEIAQYEANYPSITWIMQHNLTIMIVVAVLSWVIIFAKTFGPEGGGGI